VMATTPETTENGVGVDAHPRDRIQDRLMPGGMRAHLGGGATWTGLGLLGAIVLASIIVPAAASHSPDSIVAVPYTAPSLAHPFGTDSIGRDVFIRVFSAGRLDLTIAFLAVVASVLIGVSVGIVSGAARHRVVDVVLMRFVDAVIAFPFLVLVLALIVVLGPTRSLGPLPAGAPAVIGGIVLGNWAFYARLARGQCLSLRDRDFVVAARLLGLSSTRILLWHLMPGVVRIVAAYAVADAIMAITTVASLSYIGVGIQPPAAEWGTIMFDGRAVLSSAWWVTVLPGAVLALTGLGFALVADAALSRAESGR
jgi:peptide/nickel transport system permease protein